MKGVLTTLVLATALCFVCVAIPDTASANVNDPEPERDPLGIELPHDPPEVEGLDDEVAEGDPDDIGGGFRGCGGHPVNNGPGGHEMIEIKVLMAIIEQLMLSTLR